MQDLRPAAQQVVIEAGQFDDGLILRSLVEVDPLGGDVEAEEAFTVGVVADQALQPHEA